MSTQLQVQDFYSTLITEPSWIPETGDFDFTVTTPPEQSWWFIVVSANNSTLRDVFFYHNVIGNRIYVREEWRITWNTAHAKWEPVQINDTAQIFNYFSDMISQAFFIEKIGGLNVRVNGWYVTYNGNVVAVADQEILLDDSTTNYIRYDYATNTISSSTTDAGNVKAVVVTLAWAITSITYRNPKESYIDFSVSITWALPSQGGNAGKVLFTDGTNVYWGAIGDATTTTKGLVEIATSRETGQGTLGAPYAVTPAGLAEVYYFGDGSDGDVTISSNTSLTRDMYYNNLTVNTTFTLDPAWYAIYVLWTLTLTGTAKIARNGNNGWNALAAAKWTAGAALATWTCWPCLWGNAGADGANGAAWANGVNGVAVATSYKTTGSSVAGWNGWVGTNAAWTWGTSAAHTQWALYQTMYTFPAALRAISLPTRLFTYSQYGWLASSGSWGSGWSNLTGIGGGGGGSGWNGWIILVFANAIAGTWTIEAKWWTGWNGWNGTGTNIGGGGGGGAGGCGWVIYLVYRTGTPWTFTLTWGAWGTFWTWISGGANGTAGGDWTSGQSIILQV